MCDGPVAVTHTWPSCTGGTAIGQKAGGFLKSDRACGLQSGPGQDSRMCFLCGEETEDEDRKLWRRPHWEALLRESTKQS